MRQPMKRLGPKPVALDAAGIQAGRIMDSPLQEVGTVSSPPSSRSATAGRSQKLGTTRPGKTVPLLPRRAPTLNRHELDRLATDTDTPSIRNNENRFPRRR